MSRLGWLLADDLPLMSTVEPPPWTDVPDDLIGQTAKILRPMVRALLLAGYRPHKLDFVRSGEDTEVVSLTVGGLTAGTVAELGAPMPSIGSGIVITVTDLVHDRAVSAAKAGGWNDPQAADFETADFEAAFSHALPVPEAESGDTPWPGIEPGGDRQVVLWSRHPLRTENTEDTEDTENTEDTAQGKLNQPWVDEISWSVAGIATDIRDALENRLAEGGITPLSKAGLLWLINPLFWYRQDAAFPGQTWDEAVVGEPVPPLAWPAVTSEQALQLDPLPLLESGEVPADPNVHLLVAQASLLVPVLADEGFGHIVVTRLIFGETFEFGTMFGWNESRGSDLVSLLKTSPDVADAPTRGRLAVSAIRALVGNDYANAMYFANPNWLDVLMDLAEEGVLAPAGYPADLGGDQDIFESDVDPVRPVYYPASGAARERIVLEVMDLPAVTISATSLCEVPLLQAFAWDYVPGNPPDRLLTLMVVAGPGVEVSPGEDRGLGWDLEVIRVWSYDAVPPRGSRIQPELILAPFPLAWQPTAPDSPGRYPDGLPMYGLQVFPLPQGVALEYPIPSREGDTPAWRVTATAPEGSGRSRIAYDITFGHDESALEDFEPWDTDSVFLDEPSAAMVSLWVSPNVAVRFENLRGNPSPAPLGLMEAWKIPDAAGIPLQGACLPYEGIVVEASLGPPLPAAIDRPEGATRMEFPPEPHNDPYTELLRFMVDCGFGLIPVVGDIVDIVELTVSLYTGKDKWGRPMTRFEQLAMAACLLVPGVSNGAAKLLAREVEQGADDALGYALDLRRNQNEPLLAVVAALRGGPLPAEVQRHLDTLVGTIPPDTLARLGSERGRVTRALGEGITEHLDAAQRLGAAVGPELAQDAPRFMLIDLLTDVAPALPEAPLFPTRQFWLPSLREPFLLWCRGQGRIPDDNAVRDWILQLGTGAQAVQRATLQALLGPDLLNAAILQGVRPRVRAPRVGAWDCVAPVYFLGTSAIGAGQYARIGLDPVVAQARWLVTEAERLAREGAARVSADNRVLDFATPEQMTPVANRVELLLRNLSPATPLRPSTSQITRLLLGGRRVIDPGDMAEVLMRGTHQVGLLADRMGQATNLVRHLTVEEYLQITGHQSYFKSLLTGSGFQESSLFEVEVFFEEFARVLGPGNLIPAVPTSVARNNIILQPTYYDGRSGPDLVRRLDDLGQIVEVKQWRRVYELFDPGRQSINQMHRFADGAVTEHRYRFPDGSNLLTHPEIIVRADWMEYHRMCQRRQTEAQSRRMVQDMALQWENQVNLELRDRPDLSAAGLRLRVRVELDPLYIIWRR